MNKIITYILIIVALAGISVHSKTIWRDRNIYSPEGNLKQGDIIVVNINDISSMRFSLDLTSSSASNITSNPDMTITGFLPRISADKNMKNNDKTDFSGKGQLNFSVAATIVNAAGQGKYTIAGIRAYSFNGVTSTIRVTGVIDSALIKGRAVDSRNVSNFRLEIRGTKEGIDIKRGPLKEGDTAGVTLTEDEKQRIIIDYLQKMLGELTR